MFKWFKEKFRKRKIFFTSDLHFGHKNVIPYCNRPFKDLDEMHEHIIKVWNETVGKKDLVYVLGDFSLNPKWSKLLMPRLNGIKILVCGNHDTPHISNKKGERFAQKYLNDGWNCIYRHNTHIPLKNDQWVQLCHLPAAPKETEDFDQRYLQFRPLVAKDVPLLHGHLHGRYIKNGNQIDVSWDAHNGKIIDEDDIIKLIKDEREFIPSHLTDFYSKRKEQV